MFGKTFGHRHGATEPPIEMRFVDLFMIIVTALMFMIVMLSIVSAFVGGSNALAEASPRILTAELLAGLANRPYNVTLAGTGGSNPYTWRIVNGSLPDGVELDEKKGVIFGTPSKLQQTQFTIALIDNDNRSSEKEFSLEILQVGSQQVEIERNLYVLGESVRIPDGVENVPYNFQLNAYGGAPPYNWEMLEGGLPNGLELTREGQIVGTPKDSITSVVDVKITDSKSESITQKISLLIVQPPTPIWRKILNYVGVGINVVGYILIGLMVTFYLFGDVQSGYIYQEGRKSPWSRLRERLRK